MRGSRPKPEKAWIVHRMTSLTVAMFVSACAGVNRQRDAVPSPVVPMAILRGTFPTLPAEVATLPLPTRTNYGGSIYES